MKQEKSGNLCIKEKWKKVLDRAGFEIKKGWNQADNPTAWNMPTTVGRIHDEDHFHHSRKISVIAKVKEKAKKWRQTLARKRHGHDSNNAPSWGASLIDYEVDEDPEHHGAPMYDSEHGSEGYKKSVRQRVFGKSFNNNQERGKHPNMKKSASGAALPKSYSDNRRGNPSIPKNRINETFRAKSLDRSHHGRTTSPINTRIEAVVAERNAGLLREKLLHLQATRETAPDTVLVKEIEEHPSEIEPSTQDVIDKGAELEQKSKVPVVGKIANQTHIDRGTVNEQKEKLPILKKTTTATRGDKSTVIDLKEKLPSLNMTTPASEQQEKRPTTPKKADQEKENPFDPEKLTKSEGTTTRSNVHGEEQVSPTTKKTITETVSEKLAPAYATVSEATHKITSKIQGMSMLSFQGTGEEQKYDKGISVKEYLKNKLEPGEDERALSQVISEVISPRRTPSDKGVVEKVREAVSLMLQSEGPSSSSSSSLKHSDSASQIPVSSNAHEVEEENQGRILQAN